jgi:hypothetical protein
MPWIIAAAACSGVLFVGLVVSLIVGSWQSNPNVELSAPARETTSPSKGPDAQQARKQPKEEIKPPPPDPGPIEPKKPADPLTIAPKPANWDVKGNVREDRGALLLDNNGGQYSVISKKPLPRNFKLVIKCQVEFLKGGQFIRPSQNGIWQLLCVRFATKDATVDILERRGYLLQFSDTQMLLWRNAAVMKNEGRGNSALPMVLTITKQRSNYTVAVNDDVWLQYHDDQPLNPEERFAIGGYLSRMRLREVTVIDLGN